MQIGDVARLLEVAGKLGDPEAREEGVRGGAS
jgi:hypothetical protein